VTVGEIMAKPLPQLELRTHLDEAYRLLMAGNTGVLAVEDGKVADIITRIDLIQYWRGARGGAPAGVG
jgi:cystathionine beta-synthase